MRTVQPFALLALIATGLVSCATSPGPKPLDPAAFEEMMALAQPGPEHETLARYAGEWQGELSMMMGPDAPPMTQSAPASCRMILGGRFLQMDSSGEMMGQPYDSITMLGFDRRNDAWTLVGFDTVGTNRVTGVGKQDEQGVIRMHGRDDSPTGPQIYFFEMQFVSDDEFVSAVYFTRNGDQTYDEPFKMVEVRYARQ